MAEKIASKSKLTKKDIEHLSRKIKKDAGKKFLDVETLKELDEISEEHKKKYGNRTMSNKDLRKLLRIK